MRKKYNEIVQKGIKKYRLLGKKDGVEYCKSSAAFAAHIGLNPKTYKNYESGVAVPDYDRLIKIATALGLPSIDMLLQYDPPDQEEDSIRFFLDAIGIPFKVKVSDSRKEYMLDLPEKIKNDVLTWERMTLDTDAAEVKIYESPVLRWKYEWFGKGKISFPDSDFGEIISIYREHEDKLESLVKYPFVRQLLFLGLVKAYEDLNIGAADEEIDTEYNTILSFLLGLESFVKEAQQAKLKDGWDDIRKANGKWIQSDYWNLQDKMNSDLNSEQLREIFLDMLNEIYKNNGRGGINVIRQRVQSKK